MTATRTLLAILAVTCATGTAASQAGAADIPGGPKTKVRLGISSAQVGGTFETARDRDWYRVDLEAGRDYAFALATCDNARLTLRDAKGHALEHVDAFADLDVGVEFRPARTGTYYLDYAELRSAQCSDGPKDYPAAYRLRAAPDCLDGPGTTCRLRPGVAQRRYFAWSSDGDRYAATLERGRTYSARIEVVGGGGAELSILDAEGEVLAQSYDGAIEGFRPARDGRYFVRAAGQDDVAHQHSIILDTP